MNTAAPIEALPQAAANSGLSLRRTKQAALLCGQISLLWLVSWLGREAVILFNLPLPGSVVGVVLMFALLQSGILPLSSVEQGAGLLLRHLALFFIPIAAGMMCFGALWLSSGPAIVVDLLVSAAVGFAVTGLLCQALRRREAAVQGATALPEADHEPA